MTKLKILVILCSFLLPFILFASDDDHHAYKKSHIYKNLDFLELDKKQYKKIREVLIKYKKEYKKYYKYKEEKEEKLKKLFLEDDFNEEKYVYISRKIKEKASLLEAKNLEKIHDILDEKQRKKFSYYLKEWEVE